MDNIKLYEKFLAEGTSIFSDSVDSQITLKSTIELWDGQKVNVAAIPDKSNPKYNKGVIIVSTEDGNREIDINKDIKNVLNEATESDSVTLNVTISNIDRETADDFLKMFAFMKWTGAVGASRGFKAFFDGDGHFRPKIEVEGVDLKDVDLSSDYDDDKDDKLELGFGA